MARIIKFKVWHIEKQMYLHDWFMNEEGKIFQDDCNITEQVIVSQYTGRTDVNNREIYENDLLKDEEYNFIWTVKFVEDCFCAECPEVIELVELMDIDKHSKIVGTTYQT
jgi:hypothetical protein